MKQTRKYQLEVETGNNDEDCISDEITEEEDEEAAEPHLETFERRG